MISLFDGVVIWVINWLSMDSIEYAINQLIVKWIAQLHAWLIAQSVNQSISQLMIYFMDYWIK